MLVATSPASPEKYSVTGSLPVQLAIVRVGRGRTGGADVAAVVVVDGAMVVEVTTDLGRVVLDVALVVVECPPSVTMAVIPRAATAAMAATMMIVRFLSVDPFAGSPSGMSEMVRRTARSSLSSAVSWPTDGSTDGS